MPDVAAALAYYIAFLFSTTLHEAAHAWAALRGGDPTAYHGGQVSLDPWPHIRREPIGMVVLPLVSVLLSGWPIGFASAPYDPSWALRYPRRAAWMALAGPAANFSLVLLAAAGILLGLHAGVFMAPDAVNFDHVVVAADPATVWRGAAFMVSVVFSLNLLLATFNLMPVPPLDGSGAVPLFVGLDAGRRYQEFIRSQAAFGLLGLVLGWRLFDYIFHPIWLFAVNLVHPAAHYGG
jgi:Zn-dependent protease